MADAPPATPLLLASTSPQRRAILEQLGIPFDVVAPRYEEVTPPRSPTRCRSCANTRPGKARSVADGAAERPVVGVDTAVVLHGRIYGKPSGATEAEQMLERLSGQTHVVVSGLCLLTPGWEVVEHEATRVNFRELTPRDLAWLPRNARVGGPRRRVRDPGSRRRARPLHRRRLPERRRSSCRAARATTRGALCRYLRIWVARLATPLRRRLRRRP